MNINTRSAFVVRGWTGAIALLAGLAVSSPSQAAPIRFSASGSFELPAGAVELAGAPGEMEASGGSAVRLGTIPVGGNSGPLGDAPFRLTLSFEGLPDIDVRGEIPSIGYNPDLPVRNAVATTSATPDQIGLYPDVFQRLIAHPDWLHTTSFRGPLPDMEIGLSVHAEDLGVIRPVPEPSTALIAASAFAGLAWRSRRRSTGRQGS